MLIGFSPTLQMILSNYWIAFKQAWRLWQRWKDFHPNQVCLLRLRTVTNLILKSNLSVGLSKGRCLRDCVKIHHFLCTQTPAHWPSPHKLGYLFGRFYSNLRLASAHPYLHEWVCFSNELGKQGNSPSTAHGGIEPSSWIAVYLMWCLEGWKWKLTLSVYSTALSIYYRNRKADWHLGRRKIKISGNFAAIVRFSAQPRN